MSGQAAPSTLSQIDELLRDARLVHGYCSAVGDIGVEDLAAAINAVEALASGARVPSATEVAELRKQYALVRKKLDFDVFYSLRNGWTMFPTRWERWMTAVVVVLAILFMICVLHLTRIYNRGVELSAELTVLEASQAEKRYGELERKLLDADARLFAANLAGVPAVPTACGGEDLVKVAECNKQAEAARAAADEQYLLAREASHLMVFELVNLDQRIKDVNVRMREFLEQARYPINGMQTLEYSAWKFQAAAWSSLTSWIGCVAGPTATDGGCVLTVSNDKQQNPVVQDTPYDPRLAGMREAFCQKLSLLDDYVAGRLDKKELASADPFLGKVIYNIGDNFGISTARAIRQNCALGLSYYSGAIPDIEAINMRVKDKLSLYSMIILPAVFGALGAIVYFMRPLLSPQLPNPGKTHTLYRIALGALAGMILAWLGMGMFGTDEAFKSAGLGLFALAFILGFSIDVFFDMLDRLVGISRGAVKKIGSQTPNEAGKDSDGNGGAAGATAGSGGAAAAADPTSS